MENKTLGIIKISILGVIAVTLIMILVLIIGGHKFDGIVVKGKNKLVYNQSFKEEIKNIKVSTVNNDVKIVESNDEQINVKIYDDKDTKPEVTVEDDTLIITNKEEKKKIGIFININNNSRIIISVPKNSIYNLKVEGTSSDIDSKLDLGDININTVSGDINLRNAKTVNVKTTSGDISLENTTGLDAKTVSGDISVDKIDNTLEIGTTSGDVTIEEINLNTNSKIKTISGDVSIRRTNDIFIETSTSSGDVKINKNNRHAECELDVKTTSGDITIKN